MLITRFAMIMIAVGAASTSFPSQAQDKASSTLEQVYRYCSVREASTEMMVRARDDGTTQEAVLERLPVLDANSSDAERATPSRLRDVYSYRQLSGRALFHFRVSKCLLSAMYKEEDPKFGMALTSELLRCQSSSAEDEGLSVCIAEAANRLHRK